MNAYVTSWALRLTALVWVLPLPWVQAQHADPTNHADHASPATAASASVPAAKERKAARPQLGTGAAFAPDGQLWLSGLDEQGRLFVQTAQPPTSTGQGQGAWRWSAPRVLDTAGDKISADGENRPKLLFGPQGVVLLAYTQPLELPNTGYVRLLRSSDAGQSFAPPVTVHTDRQIITHRFESLAFDAQGALHTVWIDKRDLHAAPRVGKKSTYRGAAIYRNVSLDGGATFRPDIKVADHSCECCRIALATGADGRMRALWRHVFEPNVRDHALTVLDVQAAAPSKSVPTLVRATEDGWRVDGCPHHGPALSGASDGGFHMVWFGIRDEPSAAGEMQPVAGVRYARLRPDGQPNPHSVQRLPDARAEHADVLAQGERVAVVWRSSNHTTSTLKAWLSSDGGQHFVEKVLDQVEGANDYPRLLSRGSQAVVLWRNLKETRIYGLDF